MHKLTTEQLIARKGDLSKLRSVRRNEVYLILDNIRSIYNVGAIFRTADAVRLKKMYLCGITATPPRKELEKTALKTIDYVPWQYSKSVKIIVESLKLKGIQVVALEQTDKSVNYKDFVFKKPLAIIIGNEVTGIEQEVLDLCDSIVEIPMFGHANSLNVTTAVGVVLYKIVNDGN